SLHLPRRLCSRPVVAETWNVEKARLKKTANALLQTHRQKPAAPEPFLPTANAFSTTPAVAPEPLSSTEPAFLPKIPAATELPSTPQPDSASPTRTSSAALEPWTSTANVSQ